nr:fibrinogen-like YCDxxxxGGGW domain-containing protein [uncultured Bdellovibrio sp.]
MKTLGTPARLFAFLSHLVFQKSFAINTASEGFHLTHGTSMSIPVHNQCKILTNTHATKDYFVPTLNLTGWTTFLSNKPAAVLTKDCRSCKEIKDNGGAWIGSGMYYIDPDGAGANASYVTYCDMTTDGGGWTLVWSNLRGGTNKPTTNLSFYNTTSGSNTPRCSLANGSTSATGANCSLVTGNKEQYNYFVGLDQWNEIGKKQKYMDFMYEWRTDYGKAAAQVAKMALEKFDPFRQYTLNLLNLTNLTGSVAPGLTAYHTGKALTAVDTDVTLGGSSCSAGYSNTPFWYYTCWSGSMTGGGETMGGGYYNGAYWVNSVKAYATDADAATGQAAGNGWYYVREYSTYANCYEHKKLGGATTDGLYTIDPDGPGGNAPFQAYCDMTTDGGGWTRIFRHNIAGGYFASLGAAASANPADPTNNLYSIINKLESFRSHGRFLFRISWPGRAAKNIWYQTSNPTTDVNVAGYYPVSIGATMPEWIGLELGNGTHGAGNSNNSYIDGCNGSCWWYSIGATAAYNGGIPDASSFDGSTSHSSEVNLWVKEIDPPQIYSSCKAIYDAGYAYGNGIYYIDPDGAGNNNPPIPVYCDMTSDGGGWTRVLYHDIAGGYFANGAEANSYNVYNPTATRYSILGKLESFRRSGKLELKIDWPGYAPRNWWTQTSNFTSQAAAGYTAVSIGCSSNFWGGLEFNSSTTSSLADGSVGSGNWFYAIGAYAGWGTPVGLPSCDDMAGSNVGVPKVELWIK